MPQPLSDKAKGKQRAVEPAAPVAPTTRQLVIRFTDGIPDLELTLSKEDSVRNLKSNETRVTIEGDTGVQPLLFRPASRRGHHEAEMEYECLVVLDPG